MENNKNTNKNPSSIKELLKSPKLSTAIKSLLKSLKELRDSFDVTK